MVYAKVKKVLFFYICFSILSFVACNNAEKRNEGKKNSSMEDSIVDKKSVNHTIEEAQDNIPREFSIQQIMNKLQNQISTLEFDSSYSALSKKDCLNLPWINNEHIYEFYEVTLSTKAYKLKLNNKQYLILFGQPAGATGMGVDYKEYECYEYGNDKPTLEFSSLYAGPFAIFYNKEQNNIGYWELTKEPPIDSDSIYKDVTDYKTMLSVFTNGNCIYKDFIGNN